MFADLTLAGQILLWTVLLTFGVLLVALVAAELLPKL